MSNLNYKIIFISKVFEIVDVFELQININNLLITK